MKVNPKKLVISLLIPWIAAIVGSAFTFPAIQGWYSNLNKPPITPPNWLFSPMWTTLFTLMGLSFYMLWTHHPKHPNFILARNLFFFQLGLNALWSILFFGFAQILFAGIEIVFLWFFILATIIEFYQVDKKAAYLLLPYLAWVTVATILNLSIIFYN